MLWLQGEQHSGNKKWLQIKEKKTQNISPHPSQGLVTMERYSVNDAGTKNKTFVGHAHAGMKHYCAT